MVHSSKEIPADPGLYGQLYDGDIEEIQAVGEVISFEAEARKKLENREQLVWELVDFVTPDAVLKDMSDEDLVQTYVAMKLKEDAEIY